MDQKEWQKESERLERVLAEILLQLEKKKSSTERYREEVKEIQREMTEDVSLTLQSLSDLENATQANQYLAEIKRQVLRYQHSDMLARRLERMYANPYFGRMDFQEDGEAYAEEYYLGIATLIDEKTGEYLIYDWRAPVSSMFYDFETGRAFYKAPMGKIEGNIHLKRQYRIVGGEIELMFDSSLKIDDDILQEILSRSADSKMKTIVTSIQREQNKVIRDEKHKILVVQGAAGSGKTSIALHRAAYLLYRYKDTMKADNILIFSPNKIFNDYISNVLPELGEESILQTTFQDYTFSMLSDIYETEEHYDMMEYILGNRGEAGYDDRVACIRFKASRPFALMLKKYVKYLETHSPKFEDLTWNGKLVISASELSQLYTRDYAFLPIIQRLDKIKNRIFYLLKPLEKERFEQLMEEIAASGDFTDKGEIKARSRIAVREELRPLEEKIQAMTSFSAEAAYRKLFRSRKLIEKLWDGELPPQMDMICRHTLDCISQGYLGYEDAAPLLYLKGAFGDLPDLRSIKHVIIDEAQDYTPLQYEIIKQLFGDCRLTILGDINQSINPYMNVGSYDSILDILGEGNDAVMLTLTKSYRSTMEISNFARTILPSDIEVEYVSRQGEKPKLAEAADEKSMYDLVRKDIDKLHKQGCSSIAVICKTASQSLKAYESLKGIHGLRLVSSSDKEFRTGMVVIPSYLAKGLEFDAVLIPDADAVNYGHDDERRLLYTICTRALHRLNLYYTGSLSPFLSGAGDLVTSIRQELNSIGSKA